MRHFFSKKGGVFFAVLPLSLTQRVNQLSPIRLKSAADKMK
jgi:hypothetical protein